MTEPSTKKRKLDCNADLQEQLQEAIYHVRGETGEEFKYDRTFVIVGSVLDTPSFYARIPKGEPDEATAQKVLVAGALEDEVKNMYKELDERISLCSKICKVHFRSCINGNLGARLKRDKTGCKYVLQRYAKQGFKAVISVSVSPGSDYKTVDSPVVSLDWDWGTDFAAE